MAWGIYDKENHEFARHYGLYYDEEIVAVVDALEEGSSLSDSQNDFVQNWFLSNTYDDLIEAAEPCEGLQLYHYNTKCEAEVDCKSLFSKDCYEVRELPTDELEWEFF